MKPLVWKLIFSLVLPAFANPVPESLRRYIEKRDVTATQLTNLDFYAEYAAAAYCNSDVAVSSVVTCSNSSCPDVTADEAIVVATFGGDVTDVQGFVATDPAKEIIVAAFRGSVSIRNWITDFVFTQESCDLVTGCLVHTGFATGYDEISADLESALASATADNPSYAIIFTGHSLGAAIGTLAAGYLRESGYAIDLYTYGSPRVGNMEFAAFVTNQTGAEYRVTHVDDPVPRLPPIVLNYRHTSPEYWLATGDATTTNYTASEIEVCEGYSNIQCNAGQLTVDFDAHNYYLREIDSCSPSGIIFKRQDDEELEQKLNDYAQQDINMANSLPNEWS